MQTSAKAKYIRISPKKIRLVVDVVRGMKAEKAAEALKFMNKRAAKPVMKLINSAIANAEHNFELDKDNLFIKEIRVDEAPTLKRWMPRAHGRATTIRKRNSHINLILSEIKDSGEKAGRKQQAEAPVKLGDMGKEVKSQKSPASPKTASRGGKVKSKTIKDNEVLSVSPDAKITDYKKGDIFDEGAKDNNQEAVKEINDIRREGRGGHARAEGGKKGFSSKIFRRKSG